MFYLESFATIFLLCISNVNLSNSLNLLPSYLPIFINGNIPDLSDLIKLNL